MLRKLGKKIINNFGLKILAILFAVVMWIVVVNIDDPVIVKTYTTSVVPVNADYITTQNKYYEWLDGNNTVTFKVSAILSTGMSNSSASSSAEGRRSFSCSNFEKALLILFNEPTWFNGKRTILDCSARA